MKALLRALVVIALAASGTYAVGGVTPSHPDTTSSTDDVVTTGTTGTVKTPVAPAPKPTPGGRAFATAKRAWVSCVQDAHALHREGAKARRAAGEPKTKFSRATCGPKPHPRDFGLGSSEASGDASGRTDQTADIDDDTDEVEDDSGPAV